MKRRAFLKALVIAGISPTLIPEGVNLKVKQESDRIIKLGLAPLTNVGIGDDDIRGNEESLQYEQCLYSVDKEGNETFLKILSQKEYRKLSLII